MLTTLALVLPAAAGGDLIATDEPLTGFAKLVAGETTAYAEVVGAPNAPFVLFAAPQGAELDPFTDVPVYSGQLNEAGIASVAIPVSAQLASQATTKFSLQAVYYANGLLFTPQGGALAVGSPIGSQLLDFDYAPGPDEPVPGQQIDSEYDELGLTISAVNNSGGPNIAINFDSSNPTGGDDDLATPGPGAGNDEALGQLLIIAENDNGLATNGFVNNPDDEKEGGQILFDFADLAEIATIRLVDLDDQSQTVVTVTQDGGAMTAIPVNDVGDNGVQTVLIGLENVTQLEVDFGGSGAIADLEIFPCPITIDFNESPTGKPLELQTGEWITDQLQDFGVVFSAEGANPNLPDKAIIFDSGNPTGGDEDLQTPGPGENNDTPLGNLLIIAEDDVDADNDGLVDDPDDSAEGGTIRFDFSTTVTFFGFQVIDVDSKEIDAIVLFDINDNILVAADLGPIGENSVQNFDVPGGVPGVARGEFIFSGSGGIDSIRFCPDGSEPETSEPPVFNK